MGLVLNFSVEESPSAESLIFRDHTGDYNNPHNTGGWGGSNLDPDTVVEAKLILHKGGQSFYVELPVSTGFTAIWKDGIEIKASELGQGNYFTDGVYDFTVQLEDENGDTYPTGDEVWGITVGFAAVITREVMQDTLSYHPSNKRRHREWILEQHRLLDNLRYSSQTGNIMYFRDNLDHLKKLR